MLAGAYICPGYFFKKTMIKKILKLIVAAQAIAFPVFSVNRANSTTEKEADTFKETNTLYEHAIVDSLFITNPKTKDIMEAIGGYEYAPLLIVSPVSDLTFEIRFEGTSKQINWQYNGLAIIAWGDESQFTKIENYIDTSNLKTYSITQDGKNMGLFFGDVKNIPQDYVNKNVIVHFKEPVFVRSISPGIENYVFNPKPVDKFALTYNGLLNGYAYNMIGGREDIDPALAYEYIKNRAQLITDSSDWWNGLTMFRVATFKNGTGTFDIVGIVSGPGNVGLFSNYNSPNHSKIKELASYQKKADGYEIYATHQRSIDGYYPCTIVDETAAKFVLTSGPDFSSFLDYAKSVGYPEGYAQGLTDGQNNPTFKSFIVSAFEACSAFFSLPVLGQNITVGTLIGSFIGLGALFLIIKLFR